MENINIREILSYFKSGKYDIAEKNAAILIKKFPDNYFLCNLFGAILAGQKKFDEAVIYFEKSIQISPGYADAYNNLAGVLADQKKHKKINNTILSAINRILGTNYQLREYNINKIDKKFFIESEKLLPKNNYVGFSITQGNVYRKKEWPLSNIVKICNKLVQNNKIPVFFIIKKNHELKNKIKNLIPSALFPEHETNLSSSALVTCLGKRLDFAISIDNGVMHMLSLSKVPMIVLFGPTDSEKFAPDYKDTVILDSKKIYKSSNISSISAEDVLTAAKRYLNFLY